MRFRRPLLAFCMFLLLVVFGYMQIFDPPPWNSSCRSVAGELVEVTGTVYRKETIVSYEKPIEVFYLKTCFIKGSDRTKYSNLQLKCEMCSATDNVRLGERVRVKGVVALFSHATNPGQFDAADYYKGQGVEALLESCELLDKGYRVDALGESSFVKMSGYVLYEWRCNVKEWLWQWGNALEQRFGALLDGNNAAIMSKILLGRGEDMDTGIKNLYQDGGIYHVLSISGMHISLLGMGVYRFLRKRSVHLPVAALIGGGFILLYGAMVGFGISAIRAIGMYLVHLLGDVTGRSYDMLTAMGVMALGIALYRPKELYMAGYLLSFSCVLCLGYFTPVMTNVVCGEEKFIRQQGRAKVASWIKERLRSMVGSLSISIFTLPLQLCFFYQVPVYSVLLNLLVIPFVGTLMVLGILLLVFPFMLPFAWGISCILGWYEWICSVFLSLPGSVYIAGKPKGWSIVLFYVCIICAVFFGRGYLKCCKQKMRLMVAVLTICFGIVLVCLPQRLGTRVTFLDVGQGDCAILQTERGENILLDAGSSSGESVGMYRIVPALKSLGVNYLDAIVITHPDYDHYGALGAVLEEYKNRCGGVILPAIAKESREAEFSKVYEMMEREGALVPVYFMAVGDTLYAGEGACSERLVCLAPREGYEGDDSNAYSIVLEFVSDNLSVLFTGDVEGEGEEVLCELLENRTASVTESRYRILKVAHHGSSGSTKERFLTVMRPHLAVISCGANNRYGHPHKETLRRLDNAGAKVLTTPRNGAITIEASANGEISVFSWKTDTFSDGG